MKRIAALSITLFLCACAALSGGDAGWRALVDGGKGIENFNSVGDANWRVEDGALVADRGKGGWLISRETFRDFELRAEFWADRTTNSGIFFHCAGGKCGNASGYEVNIYDLREGQDYSTGAIVNVAKVDPPPKAGGRWNTLELTVRGPEMSVVLNGVKVASGRDAKYPDGAIGLQFGNLPKDVPGGAIKWRRVEVRPL
jgi:hypothetical protein